MHAVRDESAFLTISKRGAGSKIDDARRARDEASHCQTGRPAKRIGTSIREKKETKRVIALDASSPSTRHRPRAGFPTFPTSPLRPVCTRLLVDNPVFAKSRPGPAVNFVASDMSARNDVVNSSSRFVEPSAADGGSSRYMDTGGGDSAPRTYLPEMPIFPRGSV